MEWTVNDLATTATLLRSFMLGHVVIEPSERMKAAAAVWAVEIWFLVVVGAAHFWSVMKPMRGRRRRGAFSFLNSFVTLWARF